MGNFFGLFPSQKVCDNTEKIPPTNHAYNDDSDSSLYESCVETEDEYESSEFNKTTDSLYYSFSTEKALSNLEQRSSTKLRYHYNTHVVSNTSQICPTEASVMEDGISASWSSESDSNEPNSKTKGTANRVKSVKVEYSKSHQKQNANSSNESDHKHYFAGDSSCMTAESGADNLRSIIANWPGGDTSDQGASFATAWEIDFGAREKVEVPKKLKSKLLKKCGKKKYKRKIPSFSLRGITNEIIADRKAFDLRRWHCISRPQYKKSCGISSVVSVWNYLYSTLGSGCLPPITQEEALHLLGFKQPFQEIRFGPFTGNATLMRWFHRLNDHYGVHGRAYYLYKPKGRLQTKLMTEESALQHLKAGLLSEDMGFIYHCLNHYFCPVGYEDQPHKTSEAYYSREAITRNHENDPEKLPAACPYETWIIVGEPSRKHPPLHCKRWNDINQDLNMESPSYYDIRHTERGVQERKTKKKGGNLHCLIAFRKLQAPAYSKKQKMGK